MTKLCSLYCKTEHVDLCDARTIPSLGDLNTLHPVGRLWRFQVGQTKRSTGCVIGRSDQTSILAEFVNCSKIV